MELSEEWKSFFPVGSSTAAPLLLSSSSSLPLGPLHFNPNPNSLSLIFSSTSLQPSLHYTPYLLPSRFLLSSHPSSILPSTASSIASLFSSTQQNDAASPFLRNRLHLLTYSHRPYALILFPAGDNDHKLAFFTLCFEDSRFHTQLDTNGDVFYASTGSSHRILNISVNPVTEYDEVDGVIGYFLATTLYSVHWFAARHNQILDRPSVLCLGDKMFKTCPVAHACWSPHILEESLVLLESGHLFLFDLECFGSGAGFKGTRLKVPWNDSSESKAWLSCEFSWHPRILVVARSDAVFLVDLRLKECSVSCLMKIEMLRMYAPDENERFLALSRAAPDNFYFVVASTSVLLLCDVRKPLVPVLQWVHGIEGPSFMSVLRLSDLRSHSKEDDFQVASESGFCIMLGSIWNCEFNIFCYGSILPFRKGSVTSKISPAICAWELPLEINLSGHECHCGSCLLRKEFSKDALPEWTDWQQKKEIVLGFGILSNKLAALLTEPDENGGFTLIRLTSSGKFELQRYRASWARTRNLEDCPDQVLCLNRHLLYPMSDEDYKFPKNYNYLKLDYLDSYVSGGLTRFLVRKLKRNFKDAHDKELSPEVHELLCEKLNACGFGQLRSCPEVASVFNDVKLPASLHEVAWRRMWADLPMELLQLAFLSRAECHKVVGNLDHNRMALESLAVPELPQLPPFFLRKSSPHDNNDIVGPVIPFPVLLVVNKFLNECSNLEEGEFSVETELSLKYKEVMQVAGEIVVSAYGPTHLDDHAVSLAEDRDETWAGYSKPKSFLLYCPVSFNSSAADHVDEKSIYSDANYDTFISHIPEKKSTEQTESVGQEIFDDLSPVELRFDAPAKKLEPLGLKAYDLLKKQMSKWQQSFDSYKEFCIQSRFEKK